VLALGQGWTEVAHNPRALMCDSSRGLYGFTFESWGDERNGWRSNFSAFMIRVDAGAKTLSIAAELDTGDKFTPWNSRICFIGNTLYLVHEQGIRAYDYNTFALRGTISF
jgi:hypothetical protein